MNRNHKGNRLYSKLHWVPIVVSLSIGIGNCKKKVANQDIQDCDKIYNYYEGGTHFIRRDLVTDDGVLDYKKLLEDSKIHRSDCYPAKEQELRATIGENE